MEIKSLTINPSYTFLMFGESGNPWTISIPSGAVTANKTILQNSHATGGALFLAPLDNGNFDGGGNTGWIFSPMTGFSAGSGINAYPLILAENIFLLGDPTATDTETGYDVANIVDYRTHNFWKGASAGTKYITIDCLTAVTADALGIVGHNLYTADADISVESSPDNSTWTERLAAFAPASDKALMKTFTIASARYWRIKIVTASVAARIAVIFLGNRFEFPRYITGSFDPYPEEISAVTARSKTGNLLGSILDVIMCKISVQFTKMTESWVNNTFRPLWDTYLSQLQPFFWAWDVVNHPTEVYYGKIPDDFTLSTPYDPWRRTVTLKIETVKEQ